MKNSIEYQREMEIGYAIYSIGRLAEYLPATESRFKKILRIFTHPKRINDTLRLVKDLIPLVQAARERDWQAIANAAQYMKNRNLSEEMFVDQQLQMIASSPSKYGVKFLTKGDVLFIMQTTTPGWKPPADMRKRWKKLGLDKLPQGHGDAPSLVKWARQYEASEKGKWERQLSKMGYPLLYLRS